METDLSYICIQVVVLSDAQGPITMNQEPVLHVHTMRQTAKIVSMDQTSACKGETTMCRFRFLFYPEYISVGMTMFLRLGRTLAIGRVVSVAAAAAGGGRRGVVDAGAAAAEEGGGRDS